MSWTPWWVDQSTLLPAADSSWMWGGEPAASPAPAAAPAAAPSPVAASAPIPEWQQLNNARDAGAQSAGYGDWNSWFQANPMQASMAGINSAYTVQGQDAYFTDPNANVQAFGGYTKGADGSLVAPGAGVASYNSAVNPLYGGTGPKDLQNIIASASGTPQIADITPTQTYTENDIRKLYEARGNSAPDAAGLDWWLKQANSGAYTGNQQLTDTFNAAFTGASAPAPAGNTPAPATQTPGWLSGANQWLSSGQSGTSGGSYYDQATGKYIMPTFAKGGYDSATGDYASGALTGWNAYDRLPGNNASDYSNTPFTSFDATGKQTGTGQFGEIGKTDGIQTAALIGLALGGGAVLGNAAGLIGAPGGSAGAGVGGGVGGAGAGELSGAGLDAALQAASQEALAAYGGAGQAAVNQVSGILSMGGTLSATDVAGIVAATGLTGIDAANLTKKILADTGISSVLGTGSGANGGGGNKTGTGTGNVTINNNTGSGLDIAGILAGLYGSVAQNNAARDQRAWLDKQMSDINKLYAPGSPEHELLKQEMERKDAAAGRNSQYGPRATDLAAKIAEIKARNIANLAGSTQGNVMNSITADKTSLNSLLAALGKSGPSVTNVSSLLDLFK